MSELYEHLVCLLELIVEEISSESRQQNVSNFFKQMRMSSDVTMDELCFK